MTVTTTSLTRAAAAAAVAAGVIFIGVQINHPHLDANSIVTTEMAIRGSLKVLMAALALAGITGMYLSQVRRNGLLGLAGYLALSTGYLVILSRWSRQRRALGDAGRLLPTAGLPERHRHDRSRHLAVAHAARRHRRLR